MLMLQTIYFFRLGYRHDETEYQSCGSINEIRVLYYRMTSTYQIVVDHIFYCNHSRAYRQSCTRKDNRDIRAYKYKKMSMGHHWQLGRLDQHHKKVDSKSHFWLLRYPETDLIYLVKIVELTLHC